MMTPKVALGHLWVLVHLYQLVLAVWKLCWALYILFGPDKAGNCTINRRAFECFTICCQGVGGEGEDLVQDRAECAHVCLAT